MQVFYFHQKACQGKTSEKMNFQIDSKEQLWNLKLIIYFKKIQTFN